MTPSEGGSSHIGHFNDSGDLAMLVHLEVGHPLNTGVAIGFASCLGHGYTATLDFANAPSEGVLPLKMTVRAVAGTGIECLLFTINIDHGDNVVELREAEVSLGEDAAASVSDCKRISLDAGGAGNGDEQLGELVAGAAFAFEDVIRVMDLAQTSRFVFSPFVLAREVGVFHLHDRGIDLAEFHIG